MPVVISFTRLCTYMKKSIDIIQSLTNVDLSNF